MSHGEDAGDKQIFPVARRSKPPRSQRFTYYVSRASRLNIILGDSLERSAYLRPTTSIAEWHFRGNSGSPRSIHAFAFVIALNSSKPARLYQSRALSVSMALISVKRVISNMSHKPSVNLSRIATIAMPWPSSAFGHEIIGRERGTPFSPCRQLVCCKRMPFHFIMLAKQQS